MSFLRRHPFPVVAHFEKVVAASFAFPEDTLRPLIAAGLEMDTYEGLGFVTVAMVWTRRLRPAGFPEILGRDFFLAGYRIFTRFRRADGRRLRGLQILRSETDRRSMVWLGNAMTGYRYRRVEVQINEAADADGTRIRTTLPGAAQTLDLQFDASAAVETLPASSPFPDWHTARLFAGPMPYTFSPVGDGSFVVVEGTRQHWHPRAVAVKNWQVGLFDEAPFRDATPLLANAFAVENIHYRWETGVVLRGGADS